jgi:5-methylcytosine-specific restriction endonuclease McrA
MHPLRPPKYGAKVVFTACLRQVADKNLRRQLTAICEKIAQYDKRYRTAGRKAELYKLPTHDKVGKVSREEMIKVYTGRMAKKKASGRLYYDKLMASTPQGRCPLCGQRTVSTLDHHLPKTEYPALVVTPYNLIPACGDCNKVKLNALAATPDEQTLHPYFDNIENTVWLKAAIIQARPAAARFFVDTSVLPAKMAKRTEHHFKSFRLGPLYASHAADEIVGISHRLSDLLKVGTASAVKAHLKAEAASRVKAKKNSWQAALYTALAADDWFCQGGCEMK